MPSHVPLVVLGLLVTGLPASPPVAAGGPWHASVPSVQPAFRATMPDRFGLDTNGDGLIDLPNTAAYVRNGQGQGESARFTVRLDASTSRAALSGTALPIVGYRWRITGGDELSIARSGPLPVVEMRLPEGTYTVALDVEAALGWGTATARVEREVVVEDLLVVAVGDSYASGDGNPERPLGTGPTGVIWADSPLDAAAEAAHAAAHRSAAAWPALAGAGLGTGRSGHVGDLRLGGGHERPHRPRAAGVAVG
jgi:hypothetical protein